MKIVQVKDIVIGEGMPKVCVPIVGNTVEEILEEATYLKTLDADVMEWRADFFEQVEDIEQVEEVLKELRNILPNIPLIFTFRSLDEGGEREISAAYYVELNRFAAQTGQVDMIDVELFNKEKDIQELVTVAHDHNVLVVMSNHDFDRTPEKDEIISRLRKMQTLGGDLPKIAVMPNNTKDVLTLLQATCEMKENYADRPIITMSMAGQGVITRLAGEVFGSALTFGAAKKVSAPGQVAVAELKQTLELLHRSL